MREVAYSSKARLAVSCSLYGPIHLWDLETGKEVRRISEHGGGFHVRFSPDGKRLVSCIHTDHTVRLWDVGTGKELKRLEAPHTYGVAFSPDGKRIVSGSYPDRVMRVWDAESGKELRKYEGHTSPIAVAFFPDGRRIACANLDGTARIWRAPR